MASSLPRETCYAAFSVQKPRGLVRMAMSASMN